MSATAPAERPVRLGQRVRRQIVEELTLTVSGAKAVFAFTVQGVPVSEMETLRRSLRAVSTKIAMVKNSLARRVLAQAGLSGLNSCLEGTSGLGLAQADPVAVSKVLVTFAKDHEGFTLRGAVVERQTLGLQDIRVLAALPSREILLAKVVGGLQAPISGFVGVLSGVTRTFVYVLDAIRQSKEGKS